MPLLFLVRATQFENCYKVHCYKVFINTWLGLVFDVLAQMRGVWIEYDDVMSTDETWHIG